jgi:ribose-phosphate pyrophosphokinase
MVRNIVVLGGNSHPRFVESVCATLGLPSSSRILQKFSCGESRCEIQDSVRGKDVYIIQSFGHGDDGNRVNDHFVELCIMISACKTGSARRVTAVLPLFPYSRQPDIRYSKAGAPLPGDDGEDGSIGKNSDYTFESVPATPAPKIPRSQGLTNGVDITDLMNKAAQTNGYSNGTGGGHISSLREKPPATPNPKAAESSPSTTAMYTTHNYENLGLVSAFQSKPGYKQWVAQAGTLVANLLTCAGADRVLTCDLHESTYQGFFDIPGLSRRRLP